MRTVSNQLSLIIFTPTGAGTKVDSQNPKEKMIILAIYMAVGLSVFAMCFNLMQEEVTMKMKRFGRRVGLLRSKSEEETDADCHTVEPGGATEIQMETVRINTS
ncbi:hypothetical protein P879_00439 [Paragonimus westermani]|uniref:Potassium channel domain-containing protein n=1 Tax=Paragonimus westermani TaxID=34504 RepID=A0A8T0E0Z1_9TREM|nr:hypothetical protein P879_00439 [Paragonimus westermani]